MQKKLAERGLLPTEGYSKAFQRNTVRQETVASSAVQQGSNRRPGQIQTTRPPVCCLFSSIFF